MRIDGYALLVCTGLLLGSAACARNVQSVENRNLPEPVEWVEETVATPPAFSLSHLLPVDMPPGLSVQVGIDPDTLSLGKDGVVRYVVVMQSRSGTHMAAFEGVRCATREVKIYQRQYSDGSWSAVSNAAWQALDDPMPSHHAQALARQGLCLGSLPNTVSNMVDALKNGRKSYWELRKTN